jgi:hypothetical protein
LISSVSALLYILGLFTLVNAVAFLLDCFIFALLTAFWPFAPSFIRVFGSRLLYLRHCVSNGDFLLFLSSYSLIHLVI